MATSAGLQCEVDPVLCQALRVHKGECLIKLVVFIQLISPEGPYIKPKRSDCETHKKYICSTKYKKSLPSNNSFVELFIRSGSYNYSFVLAWRELCSLLLAPKPKCGY